MRSRFALLTIIALALATPTAALAAPANGVYHGIVNGSPAGPCGNEGEGFFRLKNGAVKPVGSANYCGGPINIPKILAPSSFECNQYNANLDVNSIPVQGGAFSYKGTAPIGPGGADRTVIFKGSWATGTKVTGTTRIKGDGCDNTDKWTMKHI